MGMGEGDSFSDIYGLSRFNETNRNYSLFKYFRKKILFLPQTIGPFKSNEVKIKAKKTLDDADIILTRDHLSFNCATDLSSNNNIINLIDVAFFLPFKSTELNKTSGSMIDTDAEFIS